MMSVVAYNDGRRRQQPTMVATAAYIDDSRGGVVARDGGRMRGRGRVKRETHRGIIMGNQYVKKGGLRHNGQNNIYSHVETSGARWGAFLGFMPHLAPINW